MIDHSNLPGKYEAWLYQHALLPRLIWQVMWLPLSSLVEEFKIAKTRLVLTLRDSPDKQTWEAGIVTCSGRKWSATVTVIQAESPLKHKDIVGLTTVGRQGIGATKTLLWSRAAQNERHVIIQSEVRGTEESRRQARALEMGPQGAWDHMGYHWEEADLGGHLEVRTTEVVHDLLPSPANPCLWGLTTDPSCKLCDRPGTLEHVLSSCSTGLTQGRFRWHHDNVLKRWLPG